MEENEEVQVQIHKPDVGILDIAHVLQKKILYLTGGRDKEGHPLIICDQFPSSFSYKDEEFNNTVMYLGYTAKILWHKQKCVIIINRLTTKWASVMIILKSLESFAEDEIEHILLLKPQGFLQKHFAKNDLKQMQNCSKHKIIIVENVGKLEQYIDKVDLPNEFGGCDYFNVTEWVEYAMAVERFQGTCKKVETRVSNMKELFAKSSSLSGLEEIDKCTKQYTQLVEDIQTDITCTIEIAETLAPIVDKSLGFAQRKSSPLEEYNSTQLKTHSEILEKLRKEVDTVWEDQKLLHKEIEKVSSFEESYGKVAGQLMEITGLLKSRTDVGNSLKDITELLEELDYFETKKKKPYEIALGLQEDIYLMITDFSYYPVDKVKGLCDEVKKLCEDFEAALSARRELLNTSCDVYKCLDQLENWCKALVDLLVSQPVESFNRKEGAKKCLKELDEFMKNNKGINMKTMNRISTITNKLGNVTLSMKVESALSRMEEVKGMLEKRETSLKKVGEKPPRPVQPVRALVMKDLSAQTIKEDESLAVEDTNSPSPEKAAPNNVASQGKSKHNKHVPKISKMAKKDIQVIPIDVETQKRNRLRKSMKLALKKPVTSVRVCHDFLQFEEDPTLKTKIMHVVTELVDTEYVYVKDLKSVIEGYFTAFDDPRYDIPEHIRANKGIIFGNIEEIYDFHNSVFLKQLKTCNDAPFLVGQVFLNHKEEFNHYASYCKNKPKSEVVRKELAGASSFLELYRQELGHRLNLDSYLLKPVQRITKYQLLLTEILKYVSQKNPAHGVIMQAVYTMKKCLRYVNDVMHSSGLISVPDDLNIDNLGKLILRDGFAVREGKKFALKQLTKTGSKHRQIFLFEQCIIISKKDIEQIGEIGTYLYKDHLMTAKLGFTEVVKGDEFAFELWTEKTERDVLYYLQADNLEMKNNWLLEIRKILMTQFQVQKNFSPLSPLMKISEKPKLLDLNTPIADNKFTFNLPEPNLHFSRTSSESDDFEEEDSGWSESEFEEQEELDYQAVISGDTLDSCESQKPKIGVNTFEAFADYDAVEESELSLSKGDLVNLLKEGDEGWWFCRNLEDNFEGWVPSSYLEPPAAVKVETSV